jgi:putative acetyltransferase
MYSTRAADANRSGMPIRLGRTLETRIEYGVMELRQATTADTAGIRRVVFEVLVEYGLQGDPDGLDADLDDVEATYINPGGMFEVLEASDGRIVGTVGLYPMSSGICELRKMCLLREARGQGMGRTMMDRVLHRARELGFVRIELETAAPLMEAIALYKKYGFRPVDSDHLSNRFDQTFALDLG